MVLLTIRLIMHLNKDAFENSTTCQNSAKDDNNQAEAIAMFSRCFYHILTLENYFSENSP